MVFVMASFNNITRNIIPILWFMILTFNQYGAYYYTVYGKAIYIISVFLLTIMTLWYLIIKGDISLSYIEIAFLIGLLLLHFSLEPNILSRYLISYLPVVIILVSAKIKDVNFNVFVGLFIFSLSIGTVIHIISLIYPDIWSLQISKGLDGDERVLTCLLSSCREVSSLYRYNFIYEEPGQAGTIFALYLLLKSNLSRWECILVTISGVLTVSLFFIGILPFILLYRAFHKHKVVCFGIISSLVIVYISFIPLVKYLNNPYVNYQIESRLVLSNNLVSGFVDNRTNQAFDYFYSSLPIDKVMFGYRQPLSDYYNGWTGLSYRNYVVEFGYINIILLLIMLLILVRKKGYSVTSTLWMAVFFILVFYQRPLVFRIEYLGFIILFLSMRHIEKQGENR